MDKTELAQMKCNAMQDALEMIDEKTTEAKLSVALWTLWTNPKSKRNISLAYSCIDELDERDDCDYNTVRMRKYLDALSVCTITPHKNNGHE